MRDPVVREFLLAFWKIHLLHHAAEQGIYGQWMLARMAERGWLRATEPKRARAPRMDRLTPRGHEVAVLGTARRRYGRIDIGDDVRRDGECHGPLELTATANAEYS